MILGAAHGSAEKFHVARQEVGGMEAGLTADLNARRAAMSPGKVAERTGREDETARRKKKMIMMEKVDLDLGMVKIVGKKERNFEKCRRRLGSFIVGVHCLRMWGFLP